MNMPYYQPDIAAAAEGATAIVAYADEICSGRFPFLGYETAALGFPPPWNIDFISGYAWSPALGARMRPVVRDNGSDVRIPWDLSRLQFLPELAKAHLLTRDMRYRSAAKDLFSDWNLKNPVGMGVNWTQAMEIALRGMSLCFMLSLLQPLRPDEQAWAHEVTQSIWQHALYTELDIEFSHLISSNHYLSNVVGLYCMSSFLDAPGMGRRRRKYRGMIHREMLRQVYLDGGDYEASCGYHLLVLQMFTSAYLVMRAERETPPLHFTERLRAMYQYLAELADEDGRVPHLGDCDDGRVELLVSDLRQMTTAPAEQRDSLLVPGAIALGDALFNLGYGGDAADSAWYGLRPPGRKATRARCVLFPQSGIAIGRMNDSEVLFFAVRNGILGTGSHTHNDKLSVVARIRGTELLCDSGTYWYTRDENYRNLFRSTAAHNTVAIDGAEQNSISPTRESIFKFGDEAKVSLIEMNDSGEEICFAASHCGYSRIGAGHKRIVRTMPNSILIEDQLSGAGEHTFEIFWHLPAIWHIDKVDDDLTVWISGPFQVKLKPESDTVLNLSHDSVPICRTYGGAFENGTRIRIADTANLPCIVNTIIRW